MISPQLIEWLKSSFMKIKVPSRLLLFLSITLATIWYITNPTGKPYIKTAGNNLEFHLTSFKDCIIHFLNPVVVNYASIEPSNRKSDAPKSQPIRSVILNKELNQIRIENIFENQSDNYYLITINSTRSLYFAIDMITIDGKDIDIKTFFKNNIESKSEYVGFRYIRQDISDFIFYENDFISNFILTFMYFSICVLILKLLDMEIKAYLYASERFKNYLEKLGINLSEKNNDNWDKYAAHWAKWDAFFRYLQTLGPATGFILTVSSLVESLHPIVTASSNIDEFLKGIHVAMISTFLGLLLRIVALEANRVNDVLLDRSDFAINQPVTDQKPNHTGSE